MIGLDTNILVRFLTADDPVQSPVARKLVESLTATDPGFISLTVLVEMHWVLRRGYRYTADQANAVTVSLLDTQEFVIDDSDMVRAALNVANQTGCDFADAVIAQRGKTAGCQTTFTFDQQASSLPSMHLLTGSFAG